MPTHSLSELNRAVSAPLAAIDIGLDYPNRANALDGVRFDIARGEVLGLIGESGSGKSSVALCLMRLVRRGKVRGSVQFEGRELLTLSEREMRAVRGREIGMVLQSPLASLNPVLRLETQMEEAWKAHRTTTKAEMSGEIRRAFELARLPSDDEFLRRYPRQLSVGLAQRVLIAMAILHRPKLLIADEPTSALDVITAAGILQLFAELNRELGTAMLFISHDLASVANLCQRVAIMKQGAIVECAETSAVFRNPSHAYTRALVAALPRLPDQLSVSSTNLSTVIEWIAGLPS